MMQENADLKEKLKTTTEKLKKTQAELENKVMPISRRLSLDYILFWHLYMFPCHREPIDQKYYEFPFLFAESKTCRLWRTFCWKGTT